MNIINSFPDGGGGGTEVTANPAGTATEDLEKLQIGTTIYGIPDDEGKADKVTNATNGNIAALNASGNLADSGKSANKVPTVFIGTTAEWSALSSAEKATYEVVNLTDDYGQMAKAEAGFTPVGTIISVMGTSAPANYLACDGQIVNITDYPILAGYFETQFGTKNHFGGDGTTTFAVPDLRGEFLRGTGNNSHTNQGNGANVGVHQDATTIPTVAYLNTESTHNIMIQRVTRDGFNGVVNFDSVVKRGTSNLVANTTENGDQSEAQSIITSRPTNTSVLYCIATKNLYMNSELQYSTEEQVVGTWIDGKPLYQKVVILPAWNWGDTKSIVHNVANIVDKIISVLGYFYDSTYHTLQTLPYIQDNNVTRAIKIQATNTQVQIYARTTDSITSSISEGGFAILQYTKITD